MEEEEGGVAGVGLGVGVGRELLMPKGRATVAREGPGRHMAQAVRCCTLIELDHMQRA